MRVIFCKLVGLEVYNKERGGGKKSRKYASVIFVRTLSERGLKNCTRKGYHNHVHFCLRSAMALE